eukprot:COSAG06_NODE_103_length_23904_cov_10.413401_6_plen_196_part_00
MHDRSSPRRRLSTRQFDHRGSRLQLCRPTAATSARAWRAHNTDGLHVRSQRGSMCVASCSIAGSRSDYEAQRLVRFHSRPAPAGMRTDCSRGWLLWICAWRVPLTLAGCGWARRFVMADDLDADWKQDHSAIMPSLTKHLKKGGPSVCHVCRTADTDRRRRRAPRTPLSCLRFIPPLTYARACLLRTVRIRRHLL